ncbi:DNA repair protein RadC [Cohnella sp. AR92]|uniref:RadC family protein n=1 Tax=Cohnella sp. AR92 TaxID=648716 RepID=UPI000F8CD2C3|nr:DNA repair protein RadC [Cohnella sp. AR92]
MSSLKHLLADTLCEKLTSYLIEEIFTRFPSNAELLDATEQELIAIKGVGKVKARQIISALKLARLLAAPTETPNKLSCPQDVWRYVSPELCYLHKEHFVCLFLNTKNHVITKETISIGSLSAAIVHPREVFRSAIKRAAASIICVHNHPSGDPTPSQEDIQLTKRLVEAGNIVGIEVLDHMIVGHEKFYSLKEHGNM